MKHGNVLVATALMAALISLPSHAGSYIECPAGLLPIPNGSGGYDTKTLDEEFGKDTQDITRCNKKRTEVKVVIQLNQYESGGRAYGLDNIQNMINDYETTHGMKRGDYEIVAVVHSGGGPLVLQDGKSFTDKQTRTLVTTKNKYEGMVENLMGQGVRFLFCQNTTRAYVANAKNPTTNELLPARLPEVDEYVGGATAMLIPGVEYTTAGVTAIADFQSLGYRYVQP